MLGGIEAGGTKWICAVARDARNVLERVRIPTASPEQTLGAAARFFHEAQAKHGTIASLGIACFGPIAVDPASPHYGTILNTPKPGWKGTDIRGFFARSLGIPVAIDTDVNGSALGEGNLGAAQVLSDFVYITIGTGIGGGVVVNGATVKGRMHPEIGHIRMRRVKGDDFESVCPYHDNCFEGLASGPAVEKRWGTKAHEIPASHEAWELEAGYIAQGLGAISMMVSPQRIILGGGLMHQTQLFPLIHAKLREEIAGYLDIDRAGWPDSDYVCAPGLGDDAGIVGALVMAEGLAR